MPLNLLSQSIWFDEAHSYFLSKFSFFEIVSKLLYDNHAPLYFFILHIWIFVVGQNEVLLRMLSLFFHILTVIISYKFGKYLKSKKFGIFMAVFVLLNPMLVQYAFEIRMYSLVEFLSLLSLYFFYTKKWLRYTIATVLGLYTHLFFLLPVLGLVTFEVIRKKSFSEIIKLLFPIVFYIPWIAVIIHQYSYTKDTWIFHTDIRIFGFISGVLFAGYEGKIIPYWIFFLTLSGLIGLFLIKGVNKVFSKQNLMLFLFLFSIICPVAFSIIVKPVFVNRYVIFAVVYILFAIGLGIFSFTKKKYRIILILTWITLEIVLNVEMSSFRDKPDYRRVFNDINAKSNKDTYILATSHNSYLISKFYYRSKDNVVIYTEKPEDIPLYVLNGFKPPILNNKDKFIGNSCIVYKNALYRCDGI